MTNLKKTLAVVLAFAMILSMGLTSMAAYSDVTAGTKVSEAVTILSNLGILTGFEDGTFRPDETVTRAQMAAIICRTLGYEDQAQSSMGSTVFNDVAADHWASGYINVAQAQQIINGYGDGNYGPEDLVTYEQAVKMIVSALGYDLAAAAKGGYPTGYLAIASAEGITKNANGTVGDAAKRSAIAVLVYNALEVPLMDQNTWSTGTDGDKYGKISETVLSKYLEVQKWEGIVEVTPYGTYAKSGYTADTTPEFSLDADAFFQEYIGVNGTITLEKYGPNTSLYNTTTVDAPTDIDCSLVDVNTLAGKKVVAYIGEDEDAETGNRMVYAIAEKQSANKVTKINMTQLVENGDKYYGDQGVIGYKEVGSSKALDLDLDDDVDMIINYGAEIGYSYDLDKTPTPDTATTAQIISDITARVGGLNGTIEFISNDNDSKIDVILVTAYTGEAVVEEVVTEDGIITLETYTNNNVMDEIDTEEEDELIIVYKDGALATVADIAANDTISEVDTGNDFRILFVSSKTVTGSVESYSTEDKNVRIAGEDYELSNFKYANVSSLKDKEGLFFLNVAGQIAHDEADATKGKYGLVLATAATTGVNNGYEVEVVLADGTTAAYDLASKAYILDPAGNTLDIGTASDRTDDKSDANVYTWLKTKMNGTSNERAKGSDLANLIFEVTVKNDKISKLKQVASGQSTSGKEYDEENMAYGNVLLTDSSVIFAIDVATTAEVESDDVIVGSVTDFFVDGEGTGFTVSAYDEDDNDDTAGAVIGFGLAAAVPDDSDAVIITSVRDITYNDDEAVYLTGIQAGKEVAYTLYDEDQSYSASLFAKGDVILVSVADAEGVISDYKALYSYSDLTDNSTRDGKFAFGADAAYDSGKDIYYYAGKVDFTTNYEPSDSQFFITGLNNTSSNPHAIVMKSSANYTLVDFSESTSNPEISRKSKGKSIFGNNSKYDSTVFVRYYDDKIVEVVVYRYNGDNYTDAVWTNTVVEDKDATAGNSIANN